jgi:hypothetical protein
MSALRYAVPKFEAELKERLFNPAVLFKPSDGNEVQIMTDCLLASFRLSPVKVTKAPPPPLPSLFTNALCVLSRE